jgi:hypothetical protein
VQNIIYIAKKIDNTKSEEASDFVLSKGKFSQHMDEGKVLHILI